MATKQIRRIATEEAFATPQQLDAIRSLMARTQGYDPDVWLAVEVQQAIRDQASRLHVA